MEILNKRIINKCVIKLLKNVLTTHKITVYYFNYNWRLKVKCKLTNLLTKKFLKNNVRKKNEKLVK